MLDRRISRYNSDRAAGKKSAKKESSGYIPKPNKKAIESLLHIYDNENAKESQEVINMKEVKGYKVFNKDWTCLDKQYTCPGKFEENVELSVCERGMHFCKRAIDCFDYYKFTPENKVAEVVAYGSVIEKGNKCCTDKLEIVREIKWEELLEIVNTGKACTGKGNSGDYNSGYYNSGNRNSGNYNSGNCNSGDCNSGYYNSGYYNSGNRNSGNRNSGNRNSGYYNSGYYNSGDCNSGDYNSGYYNSGNRNSGNYNSGNCNSGDWNKCSFSNGCFNTVEPKIHLFDKPSDWTYTDWASSKARRLLDLIPADALKYISLSDMTDEEKAEHPEAETTGGYIKHIDNSKARASWWGNLTDNEKEIIKSIPNFDRKIFMDITGIDVLEDK